MALRLLPPGSELDSATLAARHREDARRHPLLRDNPAIVERDLIAYAGIPLVDADDNVLGVLCAIDNKPRRWREEDVATLRRLAERAVTQLIAQTA